MYTVPLGVPSLLRGRSTLILEVWPGGTARWNNGRSVHGGGEGGGGRRQHQRAKQMQMKQMDSLGDRRKSTVSLTRSAHPRTNPCYTKHLSLSLSYSATTLCLPCPLSASPYRREKPWPVLSLLPPSFSFTLYIPTYARYNRC